MAVFESIFNAFISIVVHIATVGQWLVIPVIAAFILALVANITHVLLGGY